LGTWVILTGALVACGKGIEHLSGIQSADKTVTTFVVAHRTAALNAFMKVVTWTGSWIALFVVAVSIAALCWRRRLNVVVLVAVVVAWLGELLAVTLAKSVVKRPRPPEAVRLVVAHGWSFPSGHTANAVVVFAAATVVLTAFTRRRLVAVLIWVAATLAAALVAFSRIELGVHWMSDVLTSAVWTVVWALIVAGIVGVRRTGASFSPSRRPRAGLARHLPPELEAGSRQEDNPRVDGGGRLVIERDEHVGQERDDRAAGR
jgi:undecaprenyl-diphosphatase